MPRKLIHITTQPEIRPLKRGGCSIRFRIPEHDGKPESKSKRKKCPEATKKGLMLQEAEKYRQELEDELNNYAAKSDMALGQYAQKWHDDREDSGDVNHQTWKREVSLIAAIRELSIADIPIEEITDDDIDQFKREMKKAGWSTDKQQKTFKKLRQILSYAESRKVIRHDPSRNAKGIKTTPEERKTLTRPQQKKLLDALDTEPKDGQRAAVRIALAAGLRQGETLGLLWENVHLEPGASFIDLKHQLNRDKKLSQPKHGGTGQIPLDDDTAHWLAEWKREASEKLGISKDKMGKTPVCCNTKGGYYQHSNFERWWRRFAVEHGLGTYGNVYRKKNSRGENELHRTEYEGVKFHELRHTTASELLSGGADLQTTRAIMRHKSIRATEIYLHGIDENMMDAVEKVAEMRREYDEKAEQAKHDKKITRFTTHTVIPHNPKWG